MMYMGIADTLNISTLPMLTPGFFLSRQVHMNILFRGYEFFPCHLIKKKTNEMYKNTVYAKTNAGVAWVQNNCCGQLQVQSNEVCEP